MRLGSFLLTAALGVTAAAVAAGCGPDGDSDTLPGDTATAGDGDAGDGDGDTTAGDGDGDTTAGPDGPPPPPPPPAEVCDQIDIVFVIDDSPSMDEEQGNLSTNFPQFINVLDGFTTENGGPVDYRVAVTSTGRSKRWSEWFDGEPFPRFQTGLDGEFVQDCGMTRPWVEKSDPNRASEFSCAARLGTGGPLEEMPLSALRAALTDRVDDTSNAGFRREEALLAVVILTDEDDCSREANNFALGPGEFMCTNADPIAEYKAFLDDYAGGEGRWAVAAIAGPRQCSSVFGDADEAFRLKELVNQAGDTGRFGSICDGDLSLALGQALETFDTACQNLPRPE